MVGDATGSLKLFKCNRCRVGGLPQSAKVSERVLMEVPLGGHSHHQSSLSSSSAAALADGRRGRRL